MLNILKMDLFRFFRSKSLYILTGILVAYTAFTLWSLSLVESISSMDIEGMESLVSVKYTLTSLSDMFLSGSFVVLFLVIFTVIFCNAEYKSGYIKNIASTVSKKENLMFSKMIIMVIATVVFYIFLTLTLIVGGLGIMKLEVGEHAIGIVKTLLVGMLLNISIGSLIIMLFNFVRKSLIPMIVGIVYVLMGDVILQLVNFLIHRIKAFDEFDITKYTSLGNMSKLSAATESSDLIRIIIVAVVYIVISVVVSSLIAKKKDFR